MDILRRIVREPAALIGLITATVGIGIIFEWWVLTDIQTGAILTLVGAVVLFLRSYVTPVASPNLPINTIVNENSSQPTGVVVEKE